MMPVDMMFDKPIAIRYTSELSISEWYLSSNLVPSLRAARIAGEYALLFDAAVNSVCIRSMVGIMLAMQGVSLEKFKHYGFKYL